MSKDYPTNFRNKIYSTRSASFLLNFH